MERVTSNGYIRVCHGPATFVSMMMTSIVSHGPTRKALETGLVCYGGAEEDTASKARMYSNNGDSIGSHAATVTAYW
jgi:hypothetical protein